MSFSCSGVRCFTNVSLVLLLDVTKPEQVQSASLQVRKLMDGNMLYALVNNAGVADGPAADVLIVNLKGVETVCDAFASLLPPGSRVVNVSSGSASMFIQKVCGRGYVAAQQPPQC